MKTKEKDIETTESISISKILQDNYAWIIAILTLCGILLSNCIKFIDFVKHKQYFIRYGLSIEFYQYESKGFLYETVYSIILMIVIYTATTYIHNIYVLWRKSKKARITDCCGLLLLNSFIIFYLYNTPNILEFLILFISLIILEVPLSMYFQKMDKIITTMENNYETQSLKEMIKKLLICLFFEFILCVFLFGIRSISVNKNDLFKNYRTIDGHKVIMYTTKDYYLTLDCEEVGDSLVIYKGTETKINTENIHSKLVQYKNIILK